MRQPRRWIVFVSLLLVTASGNLLAADAAKRAADEQAIQKVALAYLDALNRSDFAAAAKFWAADGEYTDQAGAVTPIGELLGARQAAVDDQEAPAVERRLTGERRLRFVTDDVALEEGVSVSSSGDRFSAERGRYSVVWVRQKEGWKLSSLRDMGPEAASSDPLAALDWMIGQWTGVADDRTFDFQAEWVQDRRWMLRRFQLSVGPKQMLSGTQVIGWDPAAQQVRSWVFDSQGGFSEATWEQVGEDWHVRSSGVRGDGELTEALNSYARLGEDRLEWRSIDLGPGGGELPELIVEFTRKEGGR